MKVFVDFVSTTKIQGNVAKYTGGTNYAKYMANALYDYIEDKNKLIYCCQKVVNFPMKIPSSIPFR